MYIRCSLNNRKNKTAYIFMALKENHEPVSNISYRNTLCGAKFLREVVFTCFINSLDREKGFS